MSRKGGAGGFDPHPGDPWHPDWTPEKDDTSDADLFIDEVETLGVEETTRGGLLSRFRRRRSEGEEQSEDAEVIAQDHETEIPDFAVEGSSSVSSVYDALRDPTAEPDAEVLDADVRGALVSEESSLDLPIADEAGDGVGAAGIIDQELTELPAEETRDEPAAVTEMPVLRSGEDAEESPVEASISAPSEPVEDLEAMSREVAAQFAAETRTQTEALALADATALSAQLARVVEIGAQEARLEEARLEAERVAAEEARLEEARLEAERVAAEEARLEEARLEAERVAAEEARLEEARLEAERVAAEEARLEEARLEAERVAAEEARLEEARLEAERVAAEEARLEEARLEAERVAAEEARLEEARLEAERVAAEEARLEEARLEAERVAAEEARLEEARLEAERVAAEEARLEEARLEAERVAAEEARLEEARLEAEIGAAEAERFAQAEADAEQTRAAADLTVALAAVERVAAVEEAKASRELAGDAPGHAEDAAEAIGAPETSQIEAEEAAEAERLEEARLEAERVAAEQARVEAEEAAEAERLEEARLEAERVAAEQARAEAERLAAAQREVDRFAAAEAAALAALAAAPLIAKERAAERAAADAALREHRIDEPAAAVRGHSPATSNVGKPAATRPPRVEQAELFVEVPPAAEVAAPRPEKPTTVDDTEGLAADHVEIGAGELESGSRSGSESVVVSVPEVADSSDESTVAEDEPQVLEAAPGTIAEADVAEADVAEADVAEADVAVADVVEADVADDDALVLEETPESDDLDLVTDAVVTDDGVTDDLPLVGVDGDVDLSIEAEAGDLIFDGAETAPMDVDLGLEAAAGDAVFTAPDSAEVDDWAAYVEGYSAEAEQTAEFDASSGGLLSRVFGRRRRKKALAAKTTGVTPEPQAEASHPDIVPIDDEHHDDGTDSVDDGSAGIEDEPPGIVAPIPLDGSSEAYETIESGAFDLAGTDSEVDADEAPGVADEFEDTPETEDSPETAEPALFDVGEDEAAEAQDGFTFAGAAESEESETDYGDLLDAGLPDSDDADLETWDWDDLTGATTGGVDVEDELAQLDRDVASELADEGRASSVEAGSEEEPEGGDASEDFDAEEPDAEGPDDKGPDDGGPGDEGPDDGGPGDEGPDARGPGDDESDIAWDNFTAESYVRASTAEHVGLAEAMALAATEETEQIAISASMPGVESGLVGLEDVVAASGEDVAEIAPRAKSDLPMRIATGLLLIGTFFASLLWRPAIGLFVVAVVAIATIEFFTVLTNSGHNPLTLFGVAGVVGAMLGTWAWGPVAIPATIAITLAASLVYYGIVVGRRNPLSNLALTVMGVGWIGGFGALVFELINAQEYQWLMIALVVTVALSDVAQYFGGRNFGRRPLAPVVSPKKTVEGLISGVIVALIFGAALSLTDAFSLTEGLISGGIVAVFAPVGDLAVSVVKRTLGIKDMGVVLPGHGGVLDRIDAMIFTVPALWIVWSWMGLLA